jgi:type VI secretion system ImpM family protein
MTTSHFSAGGFGKLPQFGDFVKHNASSPEMQALDQWLQQGMQFAQRHFNQSWELAYQRAPAYHFLFYSNSAQRLLLGRLQPSFDKSMRKYPFLVWLTIEKSKLSERVIAALPAAFSVFFAHAQQLLHDASNGLEMRDIADRIEKLKMEFPGGLEEQARQHQSRLAAMTSEQLWRGLFDRFDDARKYLLFKNLTEILLPYRGRDAAKLTLGLRFPLTIDAAFREAEVNFSCRPRSSFANQIFCRSCFGARQRPIKILICFFFSGRLRSKISCSSCSRTCRATLSASWKKKVRIK